MAAAASSSTTVVRQHRLCLAHARRLSHDEGLSTDEPSMAAAPAGLGVSLQGTGEP